MAGLFFDQFEVGQVFNHQIRRTLTEMDNTLFSCLTLNPQPLHIDREFAAKTEWGQPLMNSLFTLGLMVGLSVHETTFGTLFANLGMTDVRFPAPLFAGDTVRVVSTITAKRESRSRPTTGLVEFHHQAFNQHDVLVGECKRQSLINKAPAKA
jgi:acyl dehydratase